MSIQEKILLDIYKIKLDTVLKHTPVMYGYNELFSALDGLKTELFNDMNKFTPLGRAMSEDE